MAADSGTRRRNMRLADWNYRSPGAYGVTMVTQHRFWLFGEIHDGQMTPNDAGVMVADAWQRMEPEFPRVSLDAFVVMPNHVHAILHLSMEGPVGNSLIGEVIQRFKSITTALYSDGVHHRGWPPYDRRLWQREFYDHIIRHEADLIHARRYIANNPANWSADPDHYVLKPE